MDNSGNNSLPPSPEPSADVSASHVWSTTGHEEPERSNDHVVEESQPSPECSHLEDVNEISFSQHHHQKIERQDVSNDVDYSENRISQATSTNMYDISEVKLSPGPSDLEPSSATHSHPSQYEDRLEMYHQQDEDFGEIPSTTTDPSHGELVDHDLKHYISHQEPSTSTMIMKSEPYDHQCVSDQDNHHHQHHHPHQHHHHQHHHHHHHHQHHHHLEPFSPHQPPASSTSGYEVTMENYGGVSPVTSYRNSPAPDNGEAVQPYNPGQAEGNAEVGNSTSAIEVCVPVTVSSSEVMSSAHLVQDSSQKDILAVESGGEKFTSSMEDVESIHEPTESHQTNSPHPLDPPISQDEISALSLHQRDDSTMNAVRYYNSEPLDPALAHLVNQRFSSLIAPSLVSLPASKEFFVESVMRNMIGGQSSRLYSADGVLSEEDSARLVEDPDGSLHIKEIVASSMANEVLSVDRTFPVVSMSSTLQVEPSSLSGNIIDERSLVSLPSGSQVATVLSDSLPAGLLTISPGGILVERNIVEHHLSTTESPHHSQDAISSIVSSMSGMPNLITTTTVIHDREVSSVDSLVQVSHVSASPIQSYVSSSTNGHDDGTHNLADHTIILDNTVDSTVGTSDSHLQHSKGMVGSTNEHYPTELDHQEAVALKYSTGMDVDQYTAVVTTHDENLDSGQGVSTTREEVDQRTGIILLSSDVTQLRNAVDVPSTTTLGVPLSEAIDSTLTSSSIASESLMSATSIPDNQQTLALSRPRRNLTKQRMQVVKSSESFEHLWCEECGMCYDNGCPKHRVQTIFDKPVLTRAWASLPVSYLSISKIATLNEGEAVYGVFAKKCITKRTQFGPLEGVPVKQEEPFSEHQGLVLQIETESGELVNLNTSDESLSNWMRFVRQADDYREQNLVVVQHGQSLYYTTVRNIMPRTELKVGYSIQYACRRGLAVLEPDEEMRAEEEQENSWPCFECNKRFPNSEGLQQHLNEHDVVDMVNNVEKNEEVEEESLAARKRGRPKGKSSKKSKARVTSKKFKPTGSSSPQEEFICQLCNKVFPRQYSLQRHLAMHSGEKKFTCPICQKKFTHMYNRNRHMRRHRTSTAPESETIKKPVKSLFKKKQTGGCEWVCTHCDLTFDNASLLNLHTLTHAAEDVAYQDFTRFHVETLSNSKDEELGEAGFENGDMVQSEILQCPQCTQEFHTRRELIDHASTHGKVMTRKSFRGIINPAKPYKCELCYKSFATEDRLQRHMLVHGNEEAKPLQCGVCEKRFLNNSALACHIKVHSDEKKCYECPICKEEFDQIVSLKEHIRIHSINGLFTCPSCQKTFDEYNQIRKHIRAFHSEKKFPCEHCDKIFPRPDKLKLHMLRHSSHREFLCANCGKQFKRKDKLKEHMKRMHSAEREARLANKPTKTPSSKKFIPKVSPTDYHRFIYKCHACLLGFKRRGMLVNHLAKRHPDIRPESVPELNLPILKTTRDYYCQYCEKVYKSSSKRKAHILKQHPGAELPMSNRRKGGIPEIPGMPNPTFSQTVGSITTHPHNCEWCHKQYASKAKLLQHQRKKHLELLPQAQQVPRTHLREHSGQIQQQYIAVPTSIMHQQITATTQTSEMEFDDTVIIADIKPKLVTTIGGPTTSIYMGRDEDGSSTVVVSASDLVSQPATVEGLQPADLLTQAMSELTQSLTDYQPATHEYELARVTHSCPPAVIVPSPESTPIHQASSTPTHITIEQSQLGRLLGHYEGSETQDPPAPPPPPPPLSDSPQPIVVTTDSSTFVPRTWAETYTDYPAR